LNFKLQQTGYKNAVGREQAEEEEAANHASSYADLVVIKN
jgi:hypothetical protein